MLSQYKFGNKYFKKSFEDAEAFTQTLFSVGKKKGIGDSKRC